jgi:hypothetical protein
VLHRGHGARAGACSSSGQRACPRRHGRVIQRALPRGGQRRASDGCGVQAPIHGRRYVTRHAAVRVGILLPVPRKRRRAVRVAFVAMSAAAGPGPGPGPGPRQRPRPRP